MVKAQQMAIFFLELFDWIIFLTEIFLQIYEISMHAIVP